MAINVPTLPEIEAARKGQSFWKPKTRLQETIEAKPLTKVDHKAFIAAVWRRDRNRCRCCGRNVQKVLGRVPERGEVHHIHGRGKDLRFEARAAVLLCLSCHEKVTGRVNEKVEIVGSQFFTMLDGSFIDASFPVTFRRVA